MLYFLFFCNATLPRNTAAVVCSLFPIDNRLKTPASFEPFARTWPGEDTASKQETCPLHTIQHAFRLPANCAKASPVPKKHARNTSNNSRHSLAIKRAPRRCPAATHAPATHEIYERDLRKQISTEKIYEKRLFSSLASLGPDSLPLVLKKS